MSADLSIILPEILLSLFAIFALLGAVYTGKDGIASTRSTVCICITDRIAGFFIYQVDIGVSAEEFRRVRRAVGQGSIVLYQGFDTRAGYQRRHDAVRVNVIPGFFQRV